MANIDNSTNFSSSQRLGQLIKKIRTTNHLTQAEFGELFQPPVTQSTVARWEKSVQVPDRVHFPKIAYFLDFTFEQLEKFLQESIANLDSLQIEKKTLTPNKIHLKIFKQGVSAWNKWRKKNPSIIPQLCGVELSNFNLDGINLAKADLRRVNLSHGYVCHSNLQNADLRGANLNQVQLQFSYLNGADFSNANLEDVYLNSANLSKANLTWAKLSRIDLREANLNQASLEKAIICDSLVYGASFWQTNLHKTKLESVYISPEGRKGLPINDLALAQVTYLQRHYPQIISKFLENYRLEEEAIRLATFMLEKYGEYSQTYGFHTYCNINETEQKPPYYEIRQDGDCLFIKVIPDFRDRELVLSGQANQKIILKKEGEIIESNINAQELENLQILVEQEAKRQEQRANIIVPIALEIFQINQSNQFVNQDYILETINHEVILKTNSEAKIELMRINHLHEQWQIRNSSLSENNVKYWQKLLGKLQESK